MARYRYDKDTGQLYEVGNNYFEEREPGPYVQPDIQDYQTIAGDIANDGQRIHIGSRSRHREFLRDNNYVEVGNDYDKKQVIDGESRKETYIQYREAKARRIEAIKRAAEDVRQGRGFKPHPGMYED